jgi:acetylornithine deacetylase/succinyl-diaminopimelate desuccinylase-like protein
MGNNAISMAVDILKDLKDKKFIFRKNRHLRPPTLNIGTIKGGDKVNIVADWCEIELDFRFLPGMSEAVILKGLENIVKKYSRKYKIEIQGIQKPYEIEENHLLVKSLSRAMSRLNIKPKIKGSEGATTVTFFQDKMIPAIATGFGSGGSAHASDEYVKVNNLYRGACVLEKFLKEYSFLAT